MRRPPEVSAFLDELRGELREVVIALRNVVREAVPGAAETLLWGGLSYHRPWVGGRVKGAVCQISVKRDEVRLEFIHGIRLSDPAKRLLGHAVSKRYVRVRTVGEAHAPEIADLVGEASELEFGSRRGTVRVAKKRAT